jgi:RNA polymerase sigma-70 factor, ECF subfamily
MSRSPIAEWDEAELVARLKQKDDEAYAVIVRAHAGRLLAVVRRILPNEEDARDAVQEAFLSAFQSIGSFREGSMLSTWLHRIAVNAALMRLRRARRHDERPIEDLLPTFDETGHRIGADTPWPHPGPDPGEERDRSELCRRVRLAIRELPQNYRTVLVLRDLEELSTKETAELLDTTETAIKLRLHRARQALRTMLERGMLAGTAA